MYIVYKRHPEPSEIKGLGASLAPDWHRMFLLSSYRLEQLICLLGCAFVFSAH
jgi:hypothetical protein